MDYPLNVQLAPPGVGFAVANDAEEHKRLSAAGYYPKFEDGDANSRDLDPPSDQHAIDQRAARADMEKQAEARGIKVDGRWSDKRLAEELAAK